MRKMLRRRVVGSDLQKIATATMNSRMLNALQKPKNPMGGRGRRRRQFGGCALVDKYGSYVHNY